MKVDRRSVRRSGLLCAMVCDHFDLRTVSEVEFLDWSGTGPVKTQLSAVSLVQIGETGIWDGQLKNNLTAAAKVSSLTLLRYSTCPCLVSERR